MNASSFIIFFFYMLRQNVIPFWKELFVAFKMAPNIKETLTMFLELQRLILRTFLYTEGFLKQIDITRFGTCADIVSYICKFETKWHQILDASLRYIDKAACKKKII